MRNPLTFSILLLIGCTQEVAINEKSSLDSDGDGYDVTEDCADYDPNVNPGATEICDGIDQNCNGTIDEGAMTWFYIDSDQDGFGDPGTRLADCSIPVGTVENALDCNDSNPLINPAMIEMCNEADDNCNGLIDEGVTTPFFLDADTDGYGDSLQYHDGCSPLPGHVLIGGDCDDTDAENYPGAFEKCDGIDNDCDFEIDNGYEKTPFYYDEDGDGFSTDTASTLEACAPPPDHTDQLGDCMPQDSSIHPDQIEDCFDGIDNNCNFEIDCDDISGCLEFESTCWSCGDGILNPNESCDDGNLIDDDGCSSLCESEGGCSNQADFSHQISPGLWACVKSQNITDYTTNNAMCETGSTPATYDLVNANLLPYPTQQEHDAFWIWYQNLPTSGDTDYIRTGQKRRSGCTPEAHGDLYIAVFHAYNSPQQGWYDLFYGGGSCSLPTSSANNMSHALAGVICTQGAYSPPYQ